MKISSAATYLLPFIMLLGASVITCIYEAEEYLHYYSEIYALQIIVSLFLTIGLYFAFRQLVTKFRANYIKIALIFLPLLVGELLEFIYARHFNTDFVVPIILGLLFYFSFVLFNGRYIATLTDTAIQYESLLGQKGEIPLVAVTKLEQKRNILSMLSARLRFLDMAKKTCIAFCDEQLDEYEINIFTNVFNGSGIFEKIIQNANNCGNLKIRQYVI